MRLRSVWLSSSVLTAASSSAHIIVAFPRAEVFRGEVAAADLLMYSLTSSECTGRATPSSSRYSKSCCPGRSWRALDDARDALVAHLDLVLLAALAAEVELDLRAFHVDVILAQRREPERIVLARVLLVADADRGALRSARRSSRALSRAASLAGRGRDGPRRGSPAAPWRTRSCGRTCSRRGPRASVCGSGTACARARRGRSPAGGRWVSGRSTRRCTPAGSRAT